MKRFKPPISRRSTSELIEIVHLGGWQPEAVRQAKTELDVRKVSISYQEKYLKDIENQMYDQFLEIELKFENNKNESYKNWEIILIFIFGPYFLTNRFHSSLTVFDLYRLNYNLKLKQRIITLLLSITVYFFGIYCYAMWRQDQWQKEIDKIDISNWQKYHGY